MTSLLLQSSDPLTQQVVLSGISWQTYQALRKDLGDHRRARLAYTQGILEILMPSALHEWINRILEAILRALTEELELRLRGYGSTTLDRADLVQGVEPDSCFYIQNAHQVVGRQQLDLQVDPPPDLAIEVDISRASRHRMGIYLQLQIPEVWQYSQRRGVTIYQLQGQDYVEVEFSPTFAKVAVEVSGARLTQWLQLADTEDDNGVIRAVRQWIRSHSHQS